MSATGYDPSRTTGALAPGRISRRLALPLTILVAGGLLWVAGQRRLRETRLEWVEFQELHASWSNRIEQAQASIQQLQLEKQDQNRKSDQTAIAIMRAEQDLATIDPETFWVEPPLQWPNWQSQSPYIWLRKETLMKLPIEPFTDEGALRPEVLSVLLAKEDQIRALNEALPRILAEYRAVEASRAERTENHLAGIPDDGPRATVQVWPLAQEGDRYRGMVERLILQTLGDQRGGMLLDRAEPWLTGQFGNASDKPMTLSMVRHPNNTWSVSIQGWNKWMSVGGVQNPEYYVPPHLLPLFADVLQPRASAPEKDP